MKKHSFSSLNTYTSICQRRYYWDIEDPQPFTNEDAKGRGNHVHEALEIIAKLIAAGKSPEEAFEYMAFPKGYLPDDVIRSYVQRALPVFKELNPIRGQTERWFRNVKGLDIVGKTDLVSRIRPIFSFGDIAGHDNEVCVIDHKTIMKPEKVLSEDEAFNSLQLRLYCLALNVKAAAFVYHLPEGPAMGVSVKFTEEDLDATWQELKDTITEIDGKRVLDKPGPFLLHPSPGRGLCSEKWCPHWEKCFGA